jgi:patatin-like phospholipase/acyl hydrolase
MGKFRILSLDGGGIRGVITAILLQRLTEQPGLAPWLDSVDLIAGTSTGGLIALGLAHGLSLTEIRTLYEKKGNTIFDDSWLDDLLDLGAIIGSEYDNTALGAELKRQFGNTRLGGLRKHVLITSFDLDNQSKDPSARRWKPKLFHNFPGQGTDRALLAYKVGLYTSAAPTYFPVVDGYVDGGVYANNPSMCALAQALDGRYQGAESLDEIVMLSLNGGTALTYIEGQNLDWGQAQWVKPLIGLMLDGVSGIADYQCSQILSERYHRLAPVFPPGVNYPLDGVDRISELVTFAQQVNISDAAAWLRRYWLV